MKLLLFAHKPPPHHGQSYMVQLLLEALAEESPGKSASGGSEAKHSEKIGAAPQIECFHVDCRLSDDIQDVGRVRWGKFFLLLKYCMEAIGKRFRHGIDSFYYVPAPGMRSPIYRDWIVMAFCRPFFKRIIFHWHAVGLGAWLEEQANPFERWVTRRLLGNSDLSIVLGPFYEEDVSKLSPKRIVAVPNGIPDPCPDFGKEVLPRRLARATGRARMLGAGSDLGRESRTSDDAGQIFRVLYLSLCMREKGLFDTLEAVAIVNRKLRLENSPLRVQLTIAGKFWYEREQEEFKERIAQPELSNRGASAEGHPLVVFRGFVSGQEKDQLFGESDCFCFPTYYPSEGHPVSLLEAMAYGLPIITTRWRAIPELFPPGYAGLVEPRAPEQVARKIEEFMAQNDSLSFRQTFLDNFQASRFADRMKEVLLQLDKQPFVSASGNLRT